ncbi:MAG TPA: cyclic nucleotide-binding domain-containing protein [Aggregatilinea sp.]|jgi:CRP-like cAMP-binding protein|uniref:Crp/Fnr family transcriptional regulator n=1 Tax=Aggregatilinea sp. TaxID=2806333 RepID=UPI002C77490B|nr:cyclic nucleotide-binding domain-containing protein [Aggregatilinea sp.]HML22698.1 cyclic nucleotide-binding domain-containing protein [Aggregatilinea sp.]
MSMELNFFKKWNTALTFAEGEVIFREGDPGKVMYGVQSGEVQIIVNGQVVEVVGTGGIFGEMALIEQAPRSATVIAATECVIAPVDQLGFMFLTAETPSFALMIMSTMAQRLRRMNSMVSGATPAPDSSVRIA